MSEEVLAETRVAECKCEDRKHMRNLNLPVLVAGTPTSELIHMASGCTYGRWVCPRLDRIRRRYGK